MKSEKTREIPFKNYVILGIVIVVTMFILYYFYMWIDAYKESKINIPILDKYMTVINYNELDNYLVENPDTIVYVSVLENEEIRVFEKKLKNKYRDNMLVHEVLYMDVTNNLKDNNTVVEMKNRYSLNNLNITDIPCVLVFSNGVLTSIYSIYDNEYDINKMVSYVNGIVLEDDDI